MYTQRTSSHLEWDLVESTGKIEVMRYSCCPEGYPQITYKLTLRRRTGYLNYVFVAPAAVMALLVPVMFLLPPESGEKITLGRNYLQCHEMWSSTTVIIRS